MVIGDHWTVIPTMGKGVNGLIFFERVIRFSCYQIASRNACWSFGNAPPRRLQGMSIAPVVVVVVIATESMVSHLRGDL
jgi:hypothetical protein